MAAQGRALRHLGRPGWRVNVTGCSQHRPQPHALASCLPSLSPTTTTPLTLAPFPSTQTCKESDRESGQCAWLKKETHDILGACAQLDSLSLHTPTAKSSAREREWRSKSSFLTGKKDWSLATWQSADHLEYVCPSEKLCTLPELVILEHLPLSLSYDLPQTPIAVVSLIIDPPMTNNALAEISEPPTSPVAANVPKEARRIQMLRRKKMKRHLLKKFRKRMMFTLRKMRRNARKKKEAIFQARLNNIKEWGDSFDATGWVKNELDKARRGGFYINVLDKKQ